MRQLSHWARRNKWTTRILIIGIYFGLNITGYIIGKSLDEIGTTVSVSWFISFASLAVLVWMVFPGRGGLLGIKIQNGYYLRASCHFLMGLATLGMIIYAANSNFKLPLSNVSATVSVNKDSSLWKHPLITSFKEKLQQLDKSKLTKKEKRRLIKNQIIAIDRAKNVSDGDKAGLIIISVIVALLLLFGIASLACSLSCSGSEALAILVLLLGTGLIIYLLVKTIKRIKFRKKKEKPEDKAIESGSQIP